MSAYIVENCVIDYLVTFAKARRMFLSLPATGGVGHYGKQVLTSDDASEIGQMLLDENYRSVNHRYNQTDAAPRYTFREHWGALEEMPHARAVRVLKACQCFEYQACETRDYEQSAAAAIIKQLQSDAISQLPGYDEAPWGAPQHPTGRAAPVSLLDLARAS